MAITTLSGAQSGLRPRPINFAKNALGGAVGRPRSYWGTAGNPAAGAYDTTLNGVTLTSPITGQIPFDNPASGNAYLATMEVTPVEAGAYCMVVLCDRLWHNGGYTITSTSAQNSTTPTWPARDIAGSTNGDGVLLACEISAATGAGTPTITCAYTNQSGTASRSATNILATVASSAAGSFYPIGLQAGDTGVRSLQSVTLSATWTSGTMNMVAYREIARMMCKTTGRREIIDFVTGAGQRIYDGSVPFIYIISNLTANLGFSGAIQYTDG